VAVHVATEQHGETGRDGQHVVEEHGPATPQVVAQREQTADQAPDGRDAATRVLAQPVQVARIVPGSECGGALVGFARLQCAGAVRRGGFAKGQLTPATG